MHDFQYETDTVITIKPRECHPKYMVVNTGLGYERYVPHWYDMVLTCGKNGKFTTPEYNEPALRVYCYSA